ncbi:MAG: hypothetical protein SWJ54_24765 [Cyanobacteriota bacterium]|nr:hypothetical protein [Cyanobacteriota bacterium]
MLKNLFESRIFLRLTIIVLSVLISLQLFSPVQASTNSQLSFRIRRLETQISQLRGEINSLRFQFSPQIQPIEVPQIEGEPPDPRSRLMSGDPMFNRLATLVIELKQDIQDLQERVKEIESETPT